MLDFRDSSFAAYNTLIEENRKFFYGSVSPQKPTSSFATYSYCSLKRRRRTNGGFLFLFDSTTAFKSIIHAYAYHVRKPMLTLSGGNWSLEQRDFFPPRQQGFLIKVFPKAEAPESRSLMQLRENNFRPRPRCGLGKWENNRRWKCDSSVLDVYSKKRERKEMKPAAKKNSRLRSAALPPTIGLTDDKNRLCTKGLWRGLAGFWSFDKVRKCQRWSSFANLKSLRQKYMNMEKIPQM